MMGPNPQAAPLVVAGRYRFLAELGRGGMGAVWLVEHVHTGDHLALKVLHASFGSSPDIVERFRREARAAAKIKTDHVVRVIDADISPELGNVPFMVMELLTGEDARRRLRTLGAFTREQTLHVLWQVARALDRAHAAGIVHRDIKPENIFLHKRDDGVEMVKLLDFGVAKMRDDIQSQVGDAQATQAGTLLGTPYYMAPEQVRNGAITPQTDVWAVGMLAYRFLAGANYWPSATTGELMAMILHDAMHAPSLKAPRAALPPAFDAWFARSCERDPARRWASVGEQVTALADAFGLPVPGSVSMNGPFVAASQSHSGVVHTPGIVGTPKQSNSMVGFWVALGVVVLVGVAGFGGYYIWQSRQVPSVSTVGTKSVAGTGTTTATVTATVTASAAATVTATATAAATATVTAVETMDLTSPAPTETTTAHATTTATAKPKKPEKDDPWAR